MPRMRYYRQESRLRVLAWPSPVRALENPYIRLLYSPMERCAEVVDYSVARALRGKYDVFHVHWPDWAIVQRQWWRAYPRLAAFALSMLYLRVRKVPIVWTVHNLRPHQSRSHLREALLYLLLSRAVTHQIHLTDATHTEMLAVQHPCARTPYTVVPHGLLATTEDFPPKSSARLASGLPSKPQVITFVGGIDRYKGVDTLISAFGKLKDENVLLFIAGRPASTDIEQEVTELSESDPRVRLRLGYLSDPDLAALVACSDLMVFPYRSGLNSGSVFHALAAPRRVLLPRTPTFESIQREVGEQWVSLFEHPLTADDLSTALMTFTESSSPAVSGWSDIAARTIHIYRYLAGSRP